MTRINTDNEGGADVRADKHDNTRPLALFVYRGMIKEYRDKMRQKVADMVRLGHNADARLYLGIVEDLQEIIDDPRWKRGEP